MRNLVDQMGKQTETLTALQKLVEALKSQITLTKEEGDLKLKEETHKRMESAKSFEVRPIFPNSTKGSALCCVPLAYRVR